ncbi:MAG: 3'(2'),5'-bisphosphate nucleotidase CysQ [Nitrospirae bacterium]|nr:3'(2'),5'-bisphosphate nucleotidase CysQ [Nitrospirota bacterium]
MKKYLPFILNIAIKAGKAILDIYYNKNFDVTYKDDKSPLTIADRQSHEIIMRHLSEKPFGDFPILSEEGKDIPYEERKRWEYFWLVDPLDGTKEFIKRNGEFTVNIALIHKDRPVLGVIYVPVKDVLYFAAEGINAYKLVKTGIVEEFSRESGNRMEILQSIINNSAELQLGQSTNQPINHVTIAGSRSHSTKEQEEFLDEIKKKYKEVEFISAGSSLKLCLVAEGRADIYPRFGSTMEWDTAAGQAIVEQAGGQVLDMKTKNPLGYNKESLLNPWFIVYGEKKYKHAISCL